MRVTGTKDGMRKRGDNVKGRMGRIESGRCQCLARRKIKGKVRATRRQRWKQAPQKKVVSSSDGNYVGRAVQRKASPRKRPTAAL